MTKHDKQARIAALEAEIAALTAALWDQWESNHWEHCGEWPHDDDDCRWPMPPALARNTTKEARQSPPSTKPSAAPPSEDPNAAAVCGSCRGEIVGGNCPCGNVTTTRIADVLSDASLVDASARPEERAS